MRKTKDLLVEIGTEELPPLALKELSTAFEDNFSRQLKVHDLGYKKIDNFATPRRLALKVEGLDVAQVPKIDVRKGPSQKAAVDEAGSSTKAGLGFARSCGVSVEELSKEETPKGSWLVYRRSNKGENTVDLIPHIVEVSLDALPIRKRMRWGDLSTEFVRPVHWVVLLFDDKPIVTTVLGVKSSQYTRGHRFHHPEEIKIVSPRDYEDLLRNTGKVEPRFSQRRNRIKRLAENAAKDIGATLVLNDSLLDEVTALTEWPVAIVGSFDEEFLEVPPEALIETMQKHQKYIPLVDSKKKLLPRFIALSNIESRDPSQVKKGNERVIRPRFKDAAFFWEQDLRRPLDSFREKLKKVVFQEKLGTLEEKTQRLIILSRHLSQFVELEPSLAERSAELSKCDLMSSMVGEFPSLQGVMGKYYAQESRENVCVSSALEDQYLPRHAGDNLPKSKCGQVLALADRIDTLVGIFAIGHRPSGVKDPYALRRASLAIARILIETPVDLNLMDVLKKSADTLQAKVDASSVVENVFNYIIERLPGYYSDKGVKNDTIDAVLAVSSATLKEVDKKIWAVETFKTTPEAVGLAAANKRIRNILKKVEMQEIPPSFRLDILHEPSELSLGQEITAIRNVIKPLLDKGEYSSALSRLAALRNHVDEFFDEVMVMCDDPSLRANRLALLKALSNSFLDIADISLLH